MWKYKVNNCFDLSIFTSLKIDVDVELERADTYVDLTTDIKRLIYLHTLFYLRLTYFSMNTEWLVVDVDW